MSLSDKAMLCALNIKGWTGRRTDRSLTDELASQHSADRDAVSAMVNLVPKIELADIVSVSQKMRSVHLKYTMPWLDDGTRILTGALFDEHTAALAPLIEKREACVTKFLSRLDDIRERAKIKLGDIYDEDDFPTAAEIRHRFAVRVRYMPFPDAKDFRVNLSDEEVGFLRKSIEDDVNNALDETIKDIRDRVSDTLVKFADHVDKYKVVHDPSKRGGYSVEGKLYASVINSVGEMAKLLPKLNITGDTAIHDIGLEIQSKLSSLNVDRLKASETTRRRVSDEARSILSKFNL